MNILLLALSLLAWGVIHSLLASLEIKDLLTRRLGAAPMRWYRLAYNLFAGLSFLPILWLAARLPDRQLYAIPLPWLALALAGQILALVLLAVGLKQTGLLDFTGLNALLGRQSRPASLVTRGLYRLVRHPLYTAGLLFIWLAPVMTLNLLVINLSASLYLILGALFEERKLRREFGETYRAYQAATPMLLPRLKRRGG